VNKIAQLSPRERADIFAETAARKGLSEAIVEKDFWVCWVLQQLFTIETLSGWLLFKGGTSLSKIFHAINRFSEDIDLAVNYADLGFTGMRDPRQEPISKTRRTAILTEMMIECQRYIGSEFLTAFRKRCGDILGGATWSVDVSKVDPNVVQFRYPPASFKSLSYIAPQVLLELGTHAEFVPRDRFTIRSLVAEEFPDLMGGNGEVSVIALLAKRTFWEKVTILHAEFHRPPEKVLPDRYSRHYYDVAMLAQSAIRPESLADVALLADVVKHKQTFYPSAWARYDLAQPGSLRLAPKQERMAALRRDYRNMAVMIFAKPLSFDEILESLQGLEQEINDLKGSSFIL
jgi:hypothetical protein